MTATSLAPKLVANNAAITAIRHAMGYNTTELARAAGISPSYMHRIETGEVAGSPRVHKAIAEALHVPLAAVTMPKRATSG